MLATPIAGMAQTVTGAIRGTVTDATGATIAGAQVDLTNVATGVTTSDKTAPSGSYAIRFLQIGQYRLTVAAPGFATAKYGPSPLEIDQTAKLNLPLKPGAASTNVEVSDQLQPILNTENARVGETLAENTINSIPRNGRDFSQLTVFTPAAASTNYGQYGQFGGRGSSERDTGGNAIPERAWKPPAVEQLPARWRGDQRECQQQHRLHAEAGMRSIRSASFRPMPMPSLAT